MSRRPRQRSQTLVLFALLLPVMIFGVGVAFDVGYWYMLKRQYQTAADLAALIGAHGITTTTNDTSTALVITPANTWLNNNGVSGTCTYNNLPDQTGEDDDDEDGPGGDDDDGDGVPAFGCFINHPPLSGPYAIGLGDPVVVNQYKFVEVIVVNPAPKFFLNALEGMMATFGIGNPSIYARAVAGGISPLEYAMMGLDDQNITGGSCPTGSADPICWSGGGGGATVQGNICSAGGINLDNNVTVDGNISSDAGVDAVTYPAGWSGDPDSIVEGPGDCKDPGCGNRNSLPSWVPPAVGTIPRSGDASGGYGDSDRDLTLPDASAFPGTDLYPDSTWFEPHPPGGPTPHNHRIEDLTIGGGSYTIHPNSSGGTNANRGWQHIDITSGTITFLPGNYYRASGTVDDFRITGGSITFGGAVTFNELEINGLDTDLIIPAGSNFKKLEINLPSTARTVTIKPNTSFETLEIKGGTVVMQPEGTDDKFSFTTYDQKGGTVTMRGAFYAENYCIGNTCASGSASSDPIVLGTTDDDYSDSTPPKTSTFVAKDQFLVGAAAQFGQSTTTRISAEANASVPCNLLIWLLGNGSVNKVEFSSNSTAYMNGTIYAPVIDSGGPAVHIGGGSGSAFVLDAGQIIAANIANTGTGISTVTWRISSAIFISAPYLAE